MGAILLNLWELFTFWSRTIMTIWLDKSFRMVAFKTAINHIYSTGTTKDIPWAKFVRFCGLYGGVLHLAVPIMVSSVSPAYNQ